MDVTTESGQWGWRRIVRAPRILQSRYSERVARAARVATETRKLSAPAAKEAVLAEANAVIDGCVDMLDVFAFTAVLREAAAELGIRSKSDLATRGHELRERVRALFPHDVDRTVTSGKNLLRDAPAPQREDDDFLPPLEQIVREYKVIVAGCPIESIEWLARQINQPALAHRARVSYDLLQGFVLRNELPPRLRTAGQAYALGKLTLAEVAVLLELSERDVVFELERAGYCRSIDTIAKASQLHGDDALAAIARQIIANEGRPFPFDETDVARDVVASQRIEGIDARRWS